MKTVLPPLPISPTVNTYYSHSRNGQVRLSERGRAYRIAVAAELLRAFGPYRTVLTGPLKVTAVFHRPDLRRRDLDNLQKSLYDALKHAGVYEDDSQIEHLDVRFAPLPLTEKRGTVEVTIEPLKPAKKPKN